MESGILLVKGQNPFVSLPELGPEVLSLMVRFFLELRGEEEGGVLFFLRLDEFGVLELKVLDLLFLLEQPATIDFVARLGPVKAIIESFSRSTGTLLPRRMRAHQLRCQLVDGSPIPPDLVTAQ